MIAIGSPRIAVYIVTTISFPILSSGEKCQSKKAWLKPEASNRAAPPVDKHIGAMKKPFTLLAC
jgi:hypothetical protein